MTATLHCFPGYEAQARNLAKALTIACASVAIRRFPDGESLVQVGETASAALLYCSLDDPNAKLVELLLAASALRDMGAGKVILVAPYLGYMRQDMAFRSGEAVSQRVIGGLLAGAFDGLVTVDPHLHRVALLEDVVPGIVAVNVSAAQTIADAIGASVSKGTVLVGPDEESAPWVRAVAAPLGLKVIIGQKVRHGDRDVVIRLPVIAAVEGCDVILVDDLISSGGTLITCAGLLRQAGAASVAAAVTHCLASEADIAELAAGGISPVWSTDTVPGPVATISMAGALAAAIRQHGLA